VPADLPLPAEQLEPPPGPRRWPWLPLLVPLLALSLVAGALFVTDRIGRATTGSTVQSFLPADGTSWTEQVRRSGPAGDRTDTAVTESAHIAGSAITSATDWTLATQLIGTANSDRASLDRGRFWRTTTIVPARSTTEAPQTRIYRAEQDLALMVESGPSGAFAYTPNLVELPADAAPGRTWASAGQAGGSIRYTASFRAEAAPRGCLAVSGEISYTASEVEPVRRQLSRTWCPDQGLVALAERGGGETLETDRIQATDELPRPDTNDLPAEWTPKDWRPQSYTARSVDPTFGPGEISGTPSPLLAMSRSGVLLRGTTSSQDILGFTAEDGSTWQSRWRVHPGGTILTLAAFGDAFVATTSLRTVVGYGVDGARRWTLIVPEVVLTQPVRASATELVLVTLGGEMLVVEIATGAVRWLTRPGADVGVAPVVAAGNVVVADRAGNLAGLPLADGRESWQTEAGEVTALATTDDLAVVVGPADVDGFSARTGTLRWRARLPDSATAPVPFAGGVAVLTNGGARAVDGAGRTRWVRRGVYGLTAGETHLVCWGPGGLEVLDQESQTVATFPIPAQTVGNTQRFLASADGVWLFDSSWKILRWSR
jgi:hypothetical protein